MDSDSLYQKGYQYYECKDYLHAKECFERAVALDDPSSMNMLANMYLNGLGINRDYLKAKNLFERAIATSNNDITLYNLGYMYMDGLGIKRDYHQAKQCFEHAVALDNSASMSMLGYMYLNGLGIKRDYHKAKEFLERAITTSDDPSTLYNLARLYHTGKGVEQNYTEAIKLYLQVYLNSKSDDKLLSIVLKDIMNILIHNPDCLSNILDKYRTYEKLEHEIYKLKSENALLQAKVAYQPNGAGYQEAKEDFENLISNRR